MKKCLFLILSILCSFTMSAEVSKTVNVEEAGTLKFLLGDDYLTITNLTVSGNLNGDDVITLRAMCGRDYSEASTGSGSLAVLDMRDANIVAGGSAYAGNKYSTKTTEDNAIGVAMFRDCVTLKEFYAPKTITKVGKAAFSGCTKLTKMILPAGVTEFGEWAFMNTSSMTELELPTALKSIGEGCFSGNGMAKVVIPDLVEYIPYYTYQKMPNLETIVIGAKMGTLSYSAFQHDGEYVTDIYIYYTASILGGDYQCMFDGYYGQDGKTVMELTDEDLSYITVHVPAALVSAYKSSSKWKKFNIVALNDVETGINGVETNNGKSVVARYNLNGVKISTPQKGINLLKMSDGTVKKVIMK